MAKSTIQAIQVRLRKPNQTHQRLHLYLLTTQITNCIYQPVIIKRKPNIVTIHKIFKVITHNILPILLHVQLILWHSDCDLLDVVVLEIVGKYGTDTNWHVEGG